MTDSVFDVALKKRFSNSTEAIEVTSADTLLIRDNETGVILKLPVSVLTTAIAAAAPVQSVAGKTGTVTLAKSDVGLSNVDNTSDASKPISTATQSALNGKEASIATGTTAQYWRGDKSWRDFATDVRSAVLTGLSTATNAVITATDSVLSSLGKLQKQISDNLSTLSTHTGNTSNPHSVTKAQVGLSNVDNTSDANKPVSTAQQTALDAKLNMSGGYILGNLALRDDTGANARTLYLGPSGYYASVGYNTNGDLDITARSGYFVNLNSKLKMRNQVTASSASSGSYSLPANPAGFLVVDLHGTTVKIPYYAN